ncbi:aldehyde dehydrogenase family protein [Steroidobacter sp. S1-65]|uniref:Aldehyde dehydrogenase family protein n=1 Tax=Steroidobacter gossypii TaxID=2805490 RepID=A0ABS1WXP6_9GAMM|nr:aldehyde dehydrogenase family protein [Steroidobacter gossypii]MBM0105759.1 aldehyde dehydrogenase family protein [Steroidobacter gossypii]
MYDCRRFFINGEWVTPAGRKESLVINPATEEPIGKILLGTADDVDAAVRAARAAFETYSQTSREERIALFERIAKVYEANIERLARAVSDEMGAPMQLAVQAQAGSGFRHLSTALTILKDFEFEERLGTTQILREPIGVCGLITPWNWPLNQISCKVAPALAVGCTVVLKPSEVAPVTAHIFAEILAEAGVPKGVFNLVDGDGSGVGEAMSRHPDIDMMSFTGSTRAGVLVAKAAADTVKRVSQELGGKSANIILEDADLASSVAHGVNWMMTNSGQSCNAPSRMLVPAKRYDEAVEIARKAAEQLVVGDPKAPGVTIGPLANKLQFVRVQALIAKGIEEGARVVTGGVGRPERIIKGYFVKPTIFAGVNNNMTIAREEIFGPVMVLIPYNDEEDAIRICNDSVYGLSGHVHSGNLDNARRVASKMRTGMIHVNGAARDLFAPFGGYKQSGNGREWGREGFIEFLETKAVMGWFMPVEP